MMLGDLLAAARGSAGAFHAWLAASDPGLAARVERAAVLEDDSPAGFARAAVSDFGRFASEEDWATLVSHLREAGADPGSTCLVGMVEWRLRALEDHARHDPQPSRGAHP